MTLKKTHLVTATTLAALLAITGCSSTSGNNGETGKVENTLEQKNTASVEKDEKAETASADAPSSPEAEAKPEAKEPVKTAKVIRQAPKTSTKGTHIRAIVNGVPITNNDVKKRMAFMRLRRVKGISSKAAVDELIEQNIKLQEAQRTSSLASEEQVNAAYANFAKNNKVPTKILTRELGKMGVTATHFKDYIRNQMSWNRTVSRRFSAKTRRVTEKDAIFQLKESGSNKPETTEYLVKQIVFVVPEAQRSSRLNSRKAEATALRQRFTSCDQAVELAKGLRDVAVVDRGRVMEPELPPEWKDQVVATPVNSTTKPLTTPKGVELIAVCGKRTVSDDKAAKLVSQSKAFEDFNKNRGSEEEKQYYGELLERAQVIVR